MFPSSQEKRGGTDYDGGGFGRRAPPQEPYGYGDERQPLVIPPSR